MGKNYIVTSLITVGSDEECGKYWGSRILQVVDSETFDAVHEDAPEYQDILHALHPHAFKARKETRS